MSTLSSLLVMFCVCLHSMVVVRGSVNLEVLLVNYSNPTHQDCDGGHCEGGFGIFGGNCDNIFRFQLQSSDTILSTLTTGTHEQDVFSFDATALAELRISNPITYPNLTITSPLVLQINVTDNDFRINANDHIDTITVNISDTTEISTNYTTGSYTGSCGRATIALRYQVTSNCPKDSYGPNCTTVCTPVDGRSICNYLGQTRCVTNYYRPETGCQTFCEPTATTTCDSNGNQVPRENNSGKYIGIGVGVTVGVIVIIGIIITCICVLVICRR